MGMRGGVNSEVGQKGHGEKLSLAKRTGLKDKTYLFHHLCPWGLPSLTFGSSQMTHTQPMLES